MNRPNRRDYLKNADFKQSTLSTYTDYYSYTNDMEKYCDELEDITVLKNFIDLITTNLPIYVQIWDTGGHSSWCLINDLNYDEPCWKEKIVSIEINKDDIKIITGEE